MTRVRPTPEELAYHDVRRRCERGHGVQNDRFERKIVSVHLDNVSSLKKLRHSLESLTMASIGFDPEPSISSGREGSLNCDPDGKRLTPLTQSRLSKDEPLCYILARHRLLS